MTSRTWPRTLTLIVTLALAPGWLAAQTLPPFDLTAADGQPVSSASLGRAGRWLLVYVVPGSAPSDRLVQWLGESWPAERLGDLVLIVAAAPADARTYLANKGGQGLDGAAWYADAGNAAWQALRFEGTLAVAGMTDGRLEWKLDGVIEDPMAVTPPMTAWLNAGEAVSPGP